MKSRRFGAFDDLLRTCHQLLKLCNRQFDACKINAKFKKNEATNLSCLVLVCHPRRLSACAIGECRQWPVRPRICALSLDVDQERARPEHECVRIQINTTRTSQQRSNASSRARMGGVSSGEYVGVFSGKSIGRMVRAVV